MDSTFGVIYVFTSAVTSPLRRHDIDSSGSVLSFSLVRERNDTPKKSFPDCFFCWQFFPRTTIWQIDQPSHCKIFHNLIDGFAHFRDCRIDHCIEIDVYVDLKSALIYFIGDTLSNLWLFSLVVISISGSLRKAAVMLK